MEGDQGKLVPLDRAIQGTTSRESDPAHSLFSSLVSGLISGLMGVLAAFSLSFYVFEATGLDFFPRALCAALLTSALMMLFVSFRSSKRFIFGGITVVQGGVLALMVGSVTPELLKLDPDGARVPTIIAMFALSALLVGFLFILIGRNKAGQWIRNIPQPIFGGVLAALGFFIIERGWFLLTGQPFSFLQLETIFSNPILLEPWYPALGLTVLLFITGHFRKMPFLQPLVLVLSFAGAFVWADMTGVVQETALEYGWVLPQTEMVRFWDIYSLPRFTQIDWNVVLAAVPWIVALSAVSIVNTAFRIVDIESEYHRTVNLDHEYSALGQGNIVCALAGGFPGALSSFRSRDTMRFDGGGPLAGVIGALVCVAVLVFSRRIPPYFPVFIIHAVILYTGLALLERWLVQCKRDFPRFREYAGALFIFLVSASFGLLLGIGVAGTAALIIIISRYGREDVIRHTLSGEHHRSNVDRGGSELKLLSQMGGHICIMELQGFVFLGTTYQLLKDMQERVDNDSLPALRYLILDFRHVSGMDSSVLAVFNRLKDFARNEHFMIIFTHLSFEIEQALAKRGFKLEDPNGISQMFLNTDYALEWCEDRILLEEGELVQEDNSLEDMLDSLFEDKTLASVLLRVLERVEVRKGAYVFRQGDPSDAMYFVQQGMVEVQLALEGSKTVRLKKFGAGTVFGEMGMYVEAPRSASIVAAEPCVVYKLSKKVLSALQERKPQLVSSFHEFVVNLLAMRVYEANARTRDLLR